MDSLVTSCSSPITSSSSSSSLPIFFPRRFLPSRPPLFSLASKSNDSEADPESASKDIKGGPIPRNRNLSLSPLSKSNQLSICIGCNQNQWQSECMFFTKLCVPGCGNGIGAERSCWKRVDNGFRDGRPPVPDGSEARSSTENVSTFPWSLFTKSPRRRMLVAFTCNICGQRTTRAINPHAYTDGTVFVQCCGCSAFHKLVDNLNLFHEMNCYVNPSFSYRGNGWEDMNFKFMEIEDDDNIFPIQ